MAQHYAAGGAGAQGTLRLAGSDGPIRGALAGAGLHVLYDFYRGFEHGGSQVAIAAQLHKYGSVVYIAAG